jgi:hypothetical protein
MVCEPTIVPYKHNRCRHANIIGSLKVLDQLNTGLSGGKGVNRHGGGSMGNRVIKRGWRQTTCVAVLILYSLKECHTAPFAITKGRRGCPQTLLVNCEFPISPSKTDIQIQGAHAQFKVLELTDKLASVSGERSEVASSPRKGLCS